MINGRYKIKDPTDVIGRTGGHYDPNYNYGKQPFFGYASKFLSAERGYDRGMPSNLDARQVTFLQEMRRYHFENLDPKTSNKHAFDPNKHSYNTQGFIA